MAFTKEELESGKIQIFDHLIDPIERLKVASCIRLLDVLPQVEESVIARLIECLDEKGVFKQNIKSKCNQASKLILSICKEIRSKCGHDNENENANLHAELFGYSLVEKITSELIDYELKLESIVEPPATIEDYLNKARKYSNTLINLEVGDTFIFLDESNFCEYTLVEINKVDEEDNMDLNFIYNKFNHNPVVTFSERNQYRPVMKTTALSKETAKTLHELLSK